MKLNNPVNFNSPEKIGPPPVDKLQLKSGDLQIEMTGPKKHGNQMLKFSFCEKTETLPKNSRSLENLVFSGHSAKRELKIPHSLLSRAPEYKMEPTESRARENSAPTFSPIHPNSGEDGSKLTRELLPSFTFGSQGVLLDNDRHCSDLSEEDAEGLHSGILDSMVNIFYENSVNTNITNRNFRLKPKKLSFKKLLEKKIFKSKKKSIFKNLLSKKFGVDSQQPEQVFPKPVQSVRDAICKWDLDQKTATDWEASKSPEPFPANRAGSPVRLNLLNASLPLGKKLKPRKPQKAKNKMFDFGAKFKMNSPRNTQINNMIHGLNMSKIPADFIDYSCLNSELNLPTFQAAPTPSRPPSYRENSLNFSFNPKLRSNQDTNYSISNIGENEPFELELTKPDFGKKPKTSIFETKVLSSNNLESISHTSLESESHPRFKSIDLAPESSTTYKFMINFGILN